MCGEFEQSGWEYFTEGPEGAAELEGGVFSGGYYDGEGEGLA